MILDLTHSCFGSMMTVLIWVTVLDVVYDPTPTQRTEGSSYKTARHLTVRLTNNLPANNPKPKFKEIKRHL